MNGFYGIEVGNRRVCHNTLRLHNEVKKLNRRYALRVTSSAGFGDTYSTGSYWYGELPADHKLLTGSQVDAFAKRHPEATVVDVVVLRAEIAARKAKAGV